MNPFSHIKKNQELDSASAMKTVAFLPAHPSQVWMLRPIAEQVASFANVIWVLRDKDCSVALADAMGLEYTLISKAASGLVGNALELGMNVFRCWRITRRLNVDLWVTKYGCGNLAAQLCRRHSLSFNDDDADIVPFIAWTSYPFVETVLVTQFTRMGRFEKKALRYAGLSELCYLHPNRFAPDKSVLQDLGVDDGEPYAIVRLTSLRAHHDKGIRGASFDLLRNVIKLTEGRIRLFITSENPLPSEFERLRCPIEPQRIMHAMAFAEFFLGDSQTMTSEAAVLGTPAFRINDFVGRISYIKDVEDYGLAFGFKPGQEEGLLVELEKFLDTTDRRSVFAARREKLLHDKIDPVPWFTQVIRMVLENATRQEVKAWARSEYGLS